MSIKIERKTKPAGSNTQLQFNDNGVFGGALMTYDGTNLNMKGIVLQGNSTSGGNLTLQSTAHATKGKILFGTSAYDEVNNRLGIGTTSPATPLDITQQDQSNGLRIRHNGFPTAQYLNIFEGLGGAIVNSLGAGASNGLSFQFDNSEKVRFTREGNVGIGTTNPTAVLHLKAGTATANTAPLKFTAGTNLTTPEAGTVEWDGTNLYITQTDGTRKTIAFV